MKAPVPPAQLPFIRCSIPPLKYVIFASSPPNSITTSVSGIIVSTVFEHAITSCTKPRLSHFDTDNPPDPVILILQLTFPNSS